MTTHVLLIDDDEDDFVIAKDLLRRIPGNEIELDWASNFETGFARFAQNKPDVVLLDYRLGAQTGIELLEKIREGGSTTPVILLTGQGDREIDVAAMKAGATDYLIKSELTTPILDRAIRYALSVSALNQRFADEHKRLMQIEKLSSIGMLAASVVHEVNNPLTGVKSLVEALSDDSMPAPKRSEYLAAIRDGLNRMGETMRGLLDLAREQPLTLAELAPLDVASSCLRLIGASLRSKGIAMEVRIASTERIAADRSRLMQALLNLLMNAADATPSGGKITVSLRRRANEAGITVTDTGTGIPKAIATRVLEPFFTTKPSGKGTGLGLAIVSSIAKAHKGSVEIESQGSSGTSITIWIPSR